MKFPKAVVFDLDGTLVDSAADIARAINAGFEIMGIPPFTAQDVHRIVGGGAKLAIDKAAQAAGIALSDADRARVTARFLARYAEVSAEGNGLYPGARDLLLALRARGVKTALCTNKAEPIAHIAVKALGIAELLDVTVGARDDRPRKPFPDMIHACIEPVGVSPADAVMIGDSRADADPVLRSLHAELGTYPGGTEAVKTGKSLVVPLRFDDLAFFSVTSVLGTPLDVTLQELAIEAFLPADAATAAALR